MRPLSLAEHGLGKPTVSLATLLRGARAKAEWLREQLGAILTDMVVITTGRHAYRRQDGVAVIPAVLLGP